jgi:hypothetical protein
MATDSQSGVVGGVTSSACPAFSLPCFHVSALPSDKQKSNCCYEVLHSINPIKYLSAVARSALFKARSQPGGLCGKSALVRFHKNSCVLTAAIFK